MYGRAEESTTSRFERAGSGSLRRLQGCVLTALLVANAGADERAETYVEPAIVATDCNHWSLQTPTGAPPPAIAANDRSINEIDAFVASSLDELGLQLQPAAPRRILIRRLSFDLTGLPPTASEVMSFVADQDPRAYEKLVARLLSSPRYGERWGQHWLDLARFAETDGFEHDKVRPQAWTYRDWVIDALNQDMPYDEFIRQQIAGDEIDPGDPSALTATRFCLSGPDMPDINLMAERRHTLLNEITSTVGEVILGLQIGCAQCHDHKYDPISQADFYRLRAIFEPAVQLERNKSLTVLSEAVPYNEPSHLMVRGDFRRPGMELQPGVPRVFDAIGHSFAPQPGESTAGRRAGLAEWLFNPRHPLTARVIVNRIWQHHFGAGIVDTPSDFGVMGNRPHHPDLLDWLARYLIDQRWSLKQLHRKIVTSATYRQASYLDLPASTARRDAWQSALQGDPDGRMLSRYPRWRLEGEAIRDSMLAASGQLNRNSGGPGVRPPLPDELVNTLLKNQWNVTENKSDHARRSIYVFARRNLRYPIFDVFDRPSGNGSCPRRNVSTTATQSLHLLNSRFSWETSQYLAAKIRRAHQGSESQIAAAYRQVLGRPPDRQERAEVQRYWQQSNAGTADPLAHLCLSLFNCSEFVVVD